MKNTETHYPETFNAGMIAPCGMNCSLCMAHLREKNRCLGCNGDDIHKANHCATCRIKLCDETDNPGKRFCFECVRFPCARLRHLDKRYRTKYGMSMIENLEHIREVGIEEFVIQEKNRWKCPECGGVICVHKENCIYCGHARSKPALDANASR